VEDGRLINYYLVSWLMRESLHTSAAAVANRYQWRGNHAVTSKKLSVISG
jgi:hypothetical protein